MRQTEAKKINKWAIIIVAVSLLTNFAILGKFGYRLEPDSKGYIRVADNFIQYGTLLENDIESGIMVPFTGRMPGYVVFLSGLKKIFKDTETSLMVASILQSIFLMFSALLIYYLGIHAFYLNVGIVAGLLAAIDPWASLSSIMILPDTLFYFSTSLVFLLGVWLMKNVDDPQFIHSFVWGLSIGMASMIRPVINYLWMILFPLLIYLYKPNKGVKLFLVTMVGISLFSGSWAIRNYYATGHFAFHSATGVSLLYASHKFTRHSTEEDYKSHPKLAKIRDMIATGKNPMKLLTPIRREFNLSQFELDHYLKKIALENIMENPVKMSFVFARNFVKNLTTLFNPLRNVGIGVTFPGIVVWGEKFASFFFFLVLPIVGFAIAMRKKEYRSILLFFACMVFYFVALTSLVAGSFRYRLPIHGILWVLTSIALLDFHKKINVSSVREFFKNSKRQ